MDELERKALGFALARHKDQKYGAAPYVVHLAAVRGVCARYGAPPVVCVASWLHDSLEDTDTTYADLDFNFGKDVADLVEAVTGRGFNRKARVADAYRKIRLAGTHAAFLKLADRIANVESAYLERPDLFRMYRKEFGGLNQALGHLGPTDMWRRLDDLLKNPHPTEPPRTDCDLD